MNVGDKVRVLPNEEHSLSNRTCTVLKVHAPFHRGFDVLVEMVSPTRRPSLISYTRYRRATVRMNFYFDELEVVA